MNLTFIKYLHNCGSTLMPNKWSRGSKEKNSEGSNILRNVMLGDCGRQSVKEGPELLKEMQILPRLQIQRGGLNVTKSWHSQTMKPNISVCKLSAISLKSSWQNLKLKVWFDLIYSSDWRGTNEFGEIIIHIDWFSKIKTTFPWVHATSYNHLNKWWNIKSVQNWMIA